MIDSDETPDDFEHDKIAFANQQQLLQEEMNAKLLKFQREQDKLKKSKLECQKT